MPDPLGGLYSTHLECQYMQPEVLSKCQRCCGSHPHKSAKTFSAWELCIKWPSQNDRPTCVPVCVLKNTKSNKSKPQLNKKIIETHVGTVLQRVLADRLLTPCPCKTNINLLPNLKWGALKMCTWSHTFKHRAVDNNFACGKCQSFYCGGASSSYEARLTSRSCRKSLLPLLLRVLRLRDPHPTGRHLRMCFI